MTNLMDWNAVASVLGERLDQPLILLDKYGRVRMLNQPMEHALGWSRFEIEGHPWSRFCAIPGTETEAERWITSALRGALHSYEVTALTKTAQQVIFRFEFLLLGNPPDQGLLMTATRTVPVKKFQRTSSSRDLDYMVSTLGSGFGALVRLCVGGEVVSSISEETRCYRLIHGLQQPCEHCPLLESNETPWPRTIVRQRVNQTSKALERSFEITTAEQAEAGLVRLRVRSLPDEVVGAIHRVRVDQLAQRAQLSPREREVLEYLLLGRNIEDMAKLIGIAPRTVKHHQARALQKLGAESRSDLIRLLL